MVEECLFCGILSGEVSANILDANDDAIVIADINPQAPVHLLAISKVHFSNIGEVTDQSLLGRIVGMAVAAAERHDLEDNGYRLVVNTGPNGGQTIPHLHIHVLGRRSMTWPPG